MIYFMIFLLLSGGMFSAACEVLGLPPIATAKGVRLASKKEESLQDMIINIAIMPIVKLAAPFVIMAEFKEKRMSKKLMRAGIALSPKEYIAKSIIAAVIAAIYRGKGCKKCGGDGYKGRVAIQEFLILNDELGEILDRGGTTHEIEQAAIRNGMKTIHQDGIEKALAGITTLDEVHRTVFFDEL